MCRQKQKWDVREDKSTPSSHVALFLCRVRSPAQLSLEVTSGTGISWSRPLTIVMMNSNEETLGLVPCGFLISMNCLDHFPVDPAIAPVRATGHQLVTLCRSVCAEERVQILDPLTESKHLTTYFIPFVTSLYSLYSPVHRIICRSSTCGTECCTFWSTCCWHKWHQRRWVRRKSSPSSRAVKAHLQKEKGVGADEVGRFLSLELQLQLANWAISNVVSAENRFRFSVLTHGPHEVLRHFQGVKHFARDQRLRLETPGGRVLDFEGNPFNESELERQKERILRGPLIIPDR